MRICKWLACLVLAAGLVPVRAQAQVDVESIDTVVPILYNRGRNESVTERPHPEVNSVGIHAGGFTVFPTLDTQVGYTNNVYQTSDDIVGDAFVRVAPQVQARSNWSRNSLQFGAGSEFVRYFQEGARNQTNWNVGTRGRYDVSSALALNLGLDTARLHESQLSGGAITDVRDPSPYQRTQARLLADGRFARIRIAAVADYSNYDYKSVTTLAGTTISQDFRDRDIARGAVQVEYGLTPDAGVFGQITYTDTSYDRELSPGVRNRDSKEIRMLAGVSLDISALARGSVAVGYIDRDFDAPVYEAVKGFSFDSRLEFFVTPITTVTFTAFRDVQDATVSGSAFFNTGVAARIDHELLRNLLLNGGASYALNDYVGVEGKARVFQVAGGADYLANRLVTGRLNLSYARRTSDFVGVNGPALSEFRVQVGATFHP